MSDSVQIVLLFSAVILAFFAGVIVGEIRTHFKFRLPPFAENKP